MNKHFIGSILLSSLLVACSSSPIKDMPKVEDKVLLLPAAVALLRTLTAKPADNPALVWLGIR